jgi:hypothetical protein
MTDDAELAMLQRQAAALGRDADAQWSEAIRAHVTAPPDPVAFAARLRALEAAARARAAAARKGAEARMRWVPLPGASSAEPPYELRPGTGRLGPADLWNEFDRAVARYNTATGQTDLTRVAEACEAIADAAAAIASAIEPRRRKASRGSA